MSLIGALAHCDLASRIAPPRATSTRARSANDRERERERGEEEWRFLKGVEKIGLWMSF